MSILLSAKPIKEDHFPILKDKFKKICLKGNKPKIVVILVGHHAASEIYVRHKEKFIKELGAIFDLIRLDAHVNETSFMETLSKFNQDPLVHGILVQLPLPEQLASIDTSQLIHPLKDVDGFHPLNQFGILQQGEHFKGPFACTPKAILKILDFYNVSVKSKNVLIIGRSMIVGKPLANLLLARDATVTIAHSKTKNLKAISKASDVIVLATGAPEFFDKKYLGDNLPVVIDVGISKNFQGKICGDAKFEEIKSLCSAISPVPGGVGPMTVFCLAENLLTCYQLQKGS